MTLRNKPLAFTLKQMGSHMQSNISLFSETIPVSEGSLGRVRADLVPSSWRHGRDRFWLRRASAHRTTNVPEESPLLSFGKGAGWVGRGQTQGGLADSSLSELHAAALCSTQTASLMRQILFFSLLIYFAVHSPMAIRFRIYFSGRNKKKCVR